MHAASSARRRVDETPFGPEALRDRSDLRGSERVDEQNEEQLNFNQVVFT